MTIIATLVTTKTLAAGDLTAIADALATRDRAIGIGSIVDDRAVTLDLGPTTTGLPILRDQVETACRSCGLDADVFVQQASQRNRQAFIADMDSTMITVECIDELANHIGAGSQVAAITEQAMRGELDFAASLRARVALLAGLDSAVIATLLRDRVRPSPGAATLIATLNAQGIRTGLASGGFHAFADPVAHRLGFADVTANRLEMDGPPSSGGRLTGVVQPPIVDAEAKAVALMNLCAHRGCPPSAAIAIGDGANDRAMLDRAGLAIAYRAKPALRAGAHATIDHGDLTGLLYALDLPSAAWVRRPDPRFG